MTEFKWIEFVGWTKDSRYAIFNGHDQYGNYESWVFDTDEWQPSEIDVRQRSYGQPYPACDSMGICNYGVVAIAPASSRVLLQNGFLVQLPRSVHSKLLDTLEKDQIAKAAWSNDEGQIAFAGCRHRQYSMPTDCALFIVAGDGLPAQQLVSLDGVPAKMEWEPSSSAVNVETENTRYSLNATTHQVQIVPIH